MSLATLNVEGVTPEKFAILQNSFQNSFKVSGNHTETSGTFGDHGATVDYKYDGKDVLTFSIEAIHTLFFHKPKVSEVEQGLLKWVEDTIAEHEATVVETPVENKTEEVVATGGEEKVTPPVPKKQPLQPVQTQEATQTTEPVVTAETK